MPTDAELVAGAARVLATPRAGPADSFVLHAPLELLARAALLPSVRESSREQARARIRDLATRFAGYDAVERSPDALPTGTAPELAAGLLDEVDRGDLDAVDGAARALSRVATPGDLPPLLADPLVASTAAAAHAPIFLFGFPRIAPRGEVTGEVLRGLARELARNPDWRIGWIDDVTRHPGTPDALFAALAAIPLVERAPSDTPFIHPLMAGVDGDGVASSLLAPLTGGGDVRARGQAVLRAAAWSMLLEPGDHAPYGWTHCLTLPQAALGIAATCPDPGRALAVAATHVVGFRAALAVRPLVPEFAHDDPRLTIAEAIDTSPAHAAAAVWHADGDTLTGIATELATRAAVHHDAHLVKYTLACFDAAADDAGHRRLFLAAAASLSAWWTAHDAAE